MVLIIWAAVSIARIQGVPLVGGSERSVVVGEGVVEGGTRVDEGDGSHVRGLEGGRFSGCGGCSKVLVSNA